ncbi:MAG TPA: sigma-70 family RNA polymerase sigma factor, partial [Myxococcaceae bacterium]|nr:sigma-70 family RNA polymerase sigma factor [Myxococcaceae bacterium]
MCRTHLALVHHEVRSISMRLPGHVHTDDLTSAGMSALFGAAGSFDPEQGVPFARYAARRIRGALLDELRSADWATRSLRGRVRERNSMYESLTAHLGRTPSPDELARALGISRAELLRIEGDLHQSVVLRIDHLATEAGADAILPSTAETPESVLVERERQSYLRDAVHSLPERLQKVVRGCFFEDRPMRELAEELGVTESRISQLRAEALKMLKDGMNSQLAPEMLPKATGVAANRREAYYATIASRSSFQARLGLPGM